MGYIKIPEEAREELHDTKEELALDFGVWERHMEELKKRWDRLGCKTRQGRIKIGAKLDPGRRKYYGSSEALGKEAYKNFVKFQSDPDKTKQEMAKLKENLKQFEKDISDSPFKSMRTFIEDFFTNSKYLQLSEGFKVILKPCILYYKNCPFCAYS